MAAVVAVLVLGVGGVGLAMLLSDKADEPATNAQPAQQSPAAGSTGQPGAGSTGQPAAGSTGQPAAGYAQPTDLCALADPAVLNAGRPGTTTLEDAGTPFVVNGCVWELQADDVANTFKVFAAVAGVAEIQTHYQQVETVYLSNTVPGFKSERVTGLGTRAVYTYRLSAQNRRLDAGVVSIDKNLYLELRFFGGGTRQWDPGAMRERLLTVARAALAKVPRA